MKKEKKLTVYENLMWNTIGSFTYLICQWLLTLIVVRESVGFENAGNLALAISITNIFYNLACFNVRPYLISDLNNKFSSEEYCAFRVFTCVASIGLCGVYGSFFHYDMQKMMCIMLYMLFKETEAWVDLLHGFEQRKDRMDIGGVSLFVRGILSVLSFWITLKQTDNINISIISMTIVTAVVILGFDIPNAKKFEKLSIRCEKATIWKMLIEFLPLTIGSFLSSTGTNIPRQVLEAKFGRNVLGIYSTVATPAVFVQVAASYIFNPVLVEFARCYQEKNYKKMKKNIMKISAALIALIVICMIGVKLVGKIGLTFLYGQETGKYVWVLSPVILFTGLNAFVWFFWNLLVVMRKQKELLKINVIGVVVVALVMEPVIAKYEMNGVSYVLIFYSVVLIGMMLKEILCGLRLK